MTHQTIEKKRDLWAEANAEFKVDPKTGMTPREMRDRASRLTRWEMFFYSEGMEVVKTWSTALFVCFVIALDYTPNVPI